MRNLSKKNLLFNLSELLFYELVFMENILYDYHNEMDYYYTEKSVNNIINNFPNFKKARANMLKLSM